MLQIGWSDIQAVLPALLAVLGALAAVGVDVSVRSARRAAAVEGVCYAAIGAALAVVVAFLASGRAREGFGGAVVLDPMALFLSLAVLVATGLTVVLSADAMRGKEVPAGEYHALLLLGAAGMLVLVQARDLVTFFVAIETLSLAVYALSGVFRRDARSNEASAKYLVMGAFATGFLLYGMALLYGATGSLDLVEIGRGLAAQRPDGLSFAALGFLLLGIGLCFKIGAVPFHMWVPDVYEGAPTAVTAYMSVAVKAAGVGAFVRVLLTAGETQAETWGPFLYAVAMATMVVGNLMAVVQRSVKRMLAYSSIAHTGYVLVGLWALRSGRPDAGPPVFYVFSYVFMTLGAFAFGLHAGRGGNEAERLEDLAGFAKRRPWSALAMTVFMVSLAGLPPTAGFFAKFLVFKSAVAAGGISLVVVGVLTSAVSVFYYLRVVVYMYMHPEPEGAGEPADTPNIAWVLFAASGFTLLLGLVPSAFLRYASAF